MFAALRGWLALADYNKAKGLATNKIVARLSRGNVALQNGWYMTRHGLETLKTEGDVAMKRLEQRRLGWILLTVPDFTPYRHLLVAIAAEWQKAEADIKQAEQVCEEVVTPSVFELRYAGRRIVEAINLLVEGAPSDAVEDVLRDAKLDCHRARHDAVDAAAAKIAKDVEINIEYFGQDVVVQTFPKLSELRTALQGVRGSIVAARGDLRNRDVIYADIETGKFPDLVLLYREMQIMEADMVRLLKAKRKFRLGEHVIAAIAIAVGIADLIIHLLDIHIKLG